MGFDKSLCKSNYVINTCAEKCTACGLCVKRCPMDALQLKFSAKATNKYKKAPVLDADKCIGCGVCVHKCKPRAIMLTQRDEEPFIPPNKHHDSIIVNSMAVLEWKAKNRGDLKDIIINSAAKAGWSLYKKKPELMEKIVTALGKQASKRAHKKG